MDIVLGDKQGIFARHCTRLTYVTPGANGAAQIAQLVSGTADVGFGSLVATMVAVSKGLPVQIVGFIATDYNRNGQTAYTVAVAKHGIKTYKDLEGKTVGLNGLGSEPQIAVDANVRKAGGDPSKVNYVIIPFADMATALASGRVDAVNPNQPFASELIQQGYPSLGDPMEQATGDLNTNTGAAYAAKSFLTKNPVAAKDFLLGLQAAADYAKAHPTQIRTLTSAQTHVPIAAVDKTPLPNYSAAVTTSNVQAWDTLSVKAGILKQSVPVDQVVWSGALK
jgi:NitT/TauT family transport system substrate-binding protein